MSPPSWRSYAAIMLLCIVLLTAPLGLFGLAVFGEDGAVFFAVFGLVLGVLAGLFGSLVAWSSHRHPRSWFLVLVARMVTVVTWRPRGKSDRRAG